MLEKHKHVHASRVFDGIVDNRVPQVPKGWTILFYALVIWGVLFCGYYLLSGWSSEGEFQMRMQDHQRQSSLPARAK